MKKIKVSKDTMNIINEFVDLLDFSLQVSLFTILTIIVYFELTMR